METVSREKALTLLRKYHKDPFHIQHAFTVEAVMRWYAGKLGYTEETDYWGIVGLLHDIDFERYPEEHCLRAPELLREGGIPEDMIHGVVSHGYGITVGCGVTIDVEPVHEMEKVLFAADELTGLIWAAALMRPSKSTKDMELKSLKKKYKSKGFAAGCSREVIERGAAQLGWELEKLLSMTLQAMADSEDRITAEMENLEKHDTVQFRKVALIGAGAVGAYFIYGFTDLKDLSFCVVAEGERAERLRKEGIVINERTYYPEIKSPQEAKGADLILVCTKHHGLLSTLDMIETMTEEHTTVVSLLNGIDSEEIIAERIGKEHMLYSVMRISSERREGKIHFVPETTIGVSIGEKENPEPTERVTAFSELMKRAGLKCIIEKDILLNQWEKFSMNIIYNLPQAVLGVGFGAYYNSTNVAAIRDRMFEEVCMVAKAEGIPLTKQGDWRSACAPQARFSTLQDLDAGRHTEIDMLAGTLIKLAQKHHLEVPFCEYTYYAIKALEEKNDGII